MEAYSRNTRIVSKEERIDKLGIMLKSYDQDIKWLLNLLLMIICRSISQNQVEQECMGEYPRLSDTVTLLGTLLGRLGRNSCHQLRGPISVETPQDSTLNFIT